MKKYFNFYIGIALLSLGISCAPDLKEFEPQKSAKVDYSKYIAIGNSLTAGFADGGLYLEGQQVAFPNLIAEQMKWVGGTAQFMSPFFDENTKNGSGYLHLKGLQNGQPILENVETELAYVSEGRLAKYTDEINNLGVPGMRMDMAFAPEVGTPIYGNMYLERLLKADEEGKVSYFQFSTSKDYTFFTFWLGNNDVLGYATNGAVEEGATTKLTDQNLFKQLLNNYITTLTGNEQKGAIATIPDITAIPFFTTVTRQALLAAVNAQSPEAGVKDIYIATKTTPRPATDQDLFVLPFSSSGLLGLPDSNGVPYGLHPANPVEDKYVLDEDEVKTVNSTVLAYNQAIKDIAKEKDLALVDVYSFLNEIKKGKLIQDMPFSNQFITGNAFSLDGVHLTPAGNAVIANLFINTINQKYGSKIPSIDISTFRGVKFP